MSTDDKNKNSGCNNPAYPERVGALCYPRCKEGYQPSGTNCQQKIPDGQKTTTPGFFSADISSKPHALKCREGLEQHGALCYEKTPPGFINRAGTITRQCQPGYTDLGLDCAKPKPYGRGAGSTSEQKCMNSHQGAACEKSGLLWYPKCKEGFKAFGCCTCTPSCTEGFKDTGAFCHKTGTKTLKPYPLSACPPDQDKIGALCYDKCKPGYKRTGLACHIPCEPGRFNGTACQRALYIRDPRPLGIKPGTTLIILAILAVLVMVGIRLIKR